MSLTQQGGPSPREEEREQVLSFMKDGKTHRQVRVCAQSTS